LEHSIVTNCEPIELLFGMVTAVGPGIGVIDGVNMLQPERGGLGVFSPFV